MDDHEYLEVDCDLSTEAAQVGVSVTPHADEESSEEEEVQAE
jgi:hypothetical protein